jgi:PAS domain S-box-containing protein
VLHLDVIQTYKGGAFVVLTTLLLFLLLRHGRRHEDTLQARIEGQAAQYRSLFDANPQPMWVYDLDTLAFLAVNDAAVEHYGYSRAEFLAMTIADIRPPEDVAALLSNVAKVGDGIDHAGVWRHRRKSGEVIEVEITSHVLVFDGRRAEIVLAHDFTARRAAQRRVVAAEERLRLALAAANQGLYDLDIKAGTAEINDAYGEMLGYAPGELVETNAAWLARLHPDDRERVGRVYADYVAGKLPEYRVEFRQRTKQGNWKWILSLGRVMQRDAAGTPLRMLGTHTDIDAEKQAQARIRRLSNLYAALSQCNQAIVRIRDRGELLHEICRVAVDFGGLRMAWIGAAQDGRVLTVASYGARTDYLDGAEISLDPAQPTGRGPTALSMVEDRHVLCDDIEGDPLMAPWRERALACGFLASAAFPLRCGGKPVAALNLYAPEARFFDAELVELLDEMALDISFAVDRFEIDTQRDAAERRFRTLVDHAADAVFIADLDGRIVDMNDAACASLGYRRDELLGMNVIELDPDAANLGAAEVRRIHEQAMHAGQLYLGRHRRKDGSTFPVEVRIGGMRLPDADYVIGLVRDITERLQAERALRDSEQLFRHISRASTDIAYSCRSGADGSFEIDWMVGAAERITGYTLEEIQARRCWRCLVVDEDQETFRRNVIGLPPGSSGTCELRLRRKDGGIAWVGSSAECVADPEDPHTHRLYGGLVDVGERKRAETDRERLLAEAEAARRQYRQLLERITDGFVALDRDWRYVFVNERGAELLGRQAQDLLGRHIWTEFPEGIGQPFHHAYERAMEQQSPITLEEHYAPWDRWFENHIYPSPDGLTILFQDISERKRAERALAHSESRFRTLTNLLPHGVQENDAEGRITYANPALEHINGAAPGSLVGRYIWDMLANPQERDGLREYFFHLLQAQPAPTTYFGRNRRDDGGTVDIQIDWTYRRDNDGGVVGFISIITDITERKRAQQALEESRALLEQAQRTARLGSWRYDANSGQQQWSDEVYRLFGHEPGSIASDFDNFVAMIDIADRPRVADVAQRALSGQAVEEIDYGVTLPDGSRRILHADLAPSRDASDRITGLFGTVQDVTEARHAEQALRASEARLRQVVEEMPVLLDAFDAAGNVIHWNRECERVTGYASAEMVGNPAALALLYPDATYRTRMLKLWEERGNTYRDWEWTLSAKDGSTRHISWSNISAAVSIPGWPVWGIGVDVTARREAEAALADHAERLQSLSRRLLSVQEDEKRALARELHDEIGQQLAALKLNLTVLLRGGAPTPATQRLTDCIEIADLTIERIRDAALNLRPSVLDDLGLAAALHWYARRQAERARCRIEVHASVPPLPGDIETAVFRIVQEAVNNAIRHGRAQRIDVALDLKDDWVCLRVADDGGGFDAATLCAPSTGLLSMRERAELLGGRFGIDSRRGAGTRVEADIPLELPAT